MSYSQFDPRTFSRPLIVAAHPDDETIGLGCALSTLVQPVIVHVTDGAPLDMEDAAAHGFSSRLAYAEARRTELKNAMGVAGVTVALERLDIVDQRAMFEIGSIVDGLRWLIARYRPEVLWTHPYEGGHPDHDACAYAVHLAAGTAMLPVAEFTSYHEGVHGFEAGEFLPCDGWPVVTHASSADERRRKQKMLECFATQRETLAPFQVDVERYRWAPVYDFSQLPNSGRLFCSRFRWGNWYAEPVAMLGGAVHAR